MRLEWVFAPDMRINEVIRLYPESVSAFAELGLDTCCGGNRTIAEAAGLHGLRLERIQAALARSTGLTE